MKGYHMYSKIQQFRQAGFSQRQVARRLGINRKTVKRYWEMPVNEYEEMSSAVCRMQYLDKYQSQIIGWLLEFPDMTAAQVCDWLKEHYRHLYYLCKAAGSPQNAPGKQQRHPALHAAKSAQQRQL